MAKLTIDELRDNLKSLGLVSLDGKPIAYAGFKNRATISRYGNKYKVVYVGLPKHNLFGFYTMYGNDPVVMKEAYTLFLDIVRGNIEPYMDKNVQWGNAGIPLSYGRIRTIKK